MEESNWNGLWIVVLLFAGVFGFAYLHDYFSTWWVVAGLVLMMFVGEGLGTIERENPHSKFIGFLFGLFMSIAGTGIIYIISAALYWWFVTRIPSGEGF
jgi:hypothetical protein